MNESDRLGQVLGIIGGIGLGLLLGSEFPGRYVTLLGAGLLVIFLLTMGGLSYRKKKK
jgi:hypothetical protein